MTSPRHGQSIWPEVWRSLAIFGVISLSPSLAWAEALDAPGLATTGTAIAAPSPQQPDVASDAVPLPSDGETHPSLTASTTAPAGRPEPALASTALSQQSGAPDPENARAPTVPSATVSKPARAKRATSGWIRNPHQTLPELGRLQARAALPTALKELERKLPSQSEELYSAAENARQKIRNATRWLTVADLEYTLRQRLMALAASQKRVDAHIKKANSALVRVTEILDEAKRGIDEAQRLNLEGDVLSQLRHVVREADTAQRTVQRSLGALFRLQAGLAELTEELNQVLELSITEGPSLSRDLTRLGPNIFQLLAGLSEPVSLRAALRNSVAHHIATAKSFAKASGNRVLGHAILGVTLLMAMFWVRSHAKPSSETEEPRRSYLLLRPLLSASILTSAATWFVYVAYPVSILILASGVVALLAIAVIPKLLDSVKVWHQRLLLLMWCIEISRVFLVDLAAFERLLLLAQGMVGAMAVTVTLRQARKHCDASFWAGLQCWVLRFWAAAYAIGSVAIAVGFAQTGTILVSGATTSMFMAVICVALHRILCGGVDLLRVVEAAQDSTGSVVRGRRLAHQLRTALVALLSFLWLRSSVDALSLWDPSVEALRELMEVSMEAGALKLSIGGVVALVAGLVLAVYGARFVRSVLEEDILPRTTLGIATRAATSTSIYFCVLLIGIFLAIAATGVELDKLTVIVGALGVGIGFGLQNIVQNFVAGLILIFGRPVNVEDRIQVGALTGVVRRIGFRASILRTFDGAEVIVPNSDLISAQVINWTLSDFERRMEIDIGVAYGTDPERVLQLLLGAAHAHPDVLAKPEPDALFLAHGASSLDFQLRAWTTNVSFWPKIKSDLTIAVNRALRDAGIEIPFPQRDLHLRSVDPKVLKVLDGNSVT